MNESPTWALIARSPMHVRQFLLVVLCCLINMTDGYDMLSLALAGPQLRKEWGVPPQLMGIALSATSVGIVLGSFLVARLSDRFGRRPVMLAALLIVTVAHACAAAATSIWEIGVLRLGLGVALGTLVVSLNVLVAEFSNDRWRNVLLAFGHAGFSLGMAVSGAIAAWVLEPYGWRYIFVGGAVLNFALLLLSAVFLLESPEYLSVRQPRNALARINAILALLRRPPLESLPPLPGGKAPNTRVAALLAPQLRQVSILIWIASLSFAVVGYFLLSWNPQILVNAGMTPTQASYVVIINAAFGTLGHLSMAYLSRWVEETRLTAIYFALMALMLVAFGTVPASLPVLLGASGILTLFTVGSYTGLFLVAVKFYSTETRNVGVGCVVGWQRVGSIVGPMLGGLLIGANLDRVMTLVVFAAIAVVPVMSMSWAARARSGAT
jgi:MFS family permease